MQKTLRQLMDDMAQLESVQTQENIGALLGKVLGSKLGTAAIGGAIGSAATKAFSSNKAGDTADTGHASGGVNAQPGTTAGPTANTNTERDDLGVKKSDYQAHPQMVFKSSMSSQPGRYTDLIEKLVKARGSHNGYPVTLIGTWEINGTTVALLGRDNWFTREWIDYSGLASEGTLKRYIEPLGFKLVGTSKFSANNQFGGADGYIEQYEGKGARFVFAESSQLVAFNIPGNGMGLHLLATMSFSPAAVFEKVGTKPIMDLLSTVSLDGVTQYKGKGTMNEGLISAAVSKLLGSRLGAAGLGAAAGFGAAKLAGSDWFSGDSEKDKETEKDKPADNKVNAQPSASTVGGAATTAGMGSSSGSIAADGTKNTPENAPTGGQWYDIENQYAVNPGAFRIARDWKDGQTNLDSEGRLINPYDNKEVPPAILHMEARKGWTKPMVNFDGKPIRADDSYSLPKEPDHPYYHLVVVKTGERQDPWRARLMSLMEKDRYGYQKHNYTPSKSPSVVFDVPGGYNPGGNEIAEKIMHPFRKNLIGCWKNSNGAAIWIEWQKAPYGSLAGSIDGQIASSYQNMTTKELAGYEKSEGGSATFNNVGHTEGDSPVGKWYGLSFQASGGKYEKDRVDCRFTNNVPSMDATGALHIDLYHIRYVGPSSDWNSGGRSALTQMTASAKYADGSGPVKRKGINEDLSRIIDLVRK